MIEKRYSTNPEFDVLLRKMGEIHDKKRKDYTSGDPLGNFYEALRIGITPLQGIMVRIGDKYSRICNIVRNRGKHEVEDETLEDTLLDLANYCLLAILLHKREE